MVMIQRTLQRIFRFLARAALRRSHARIVAVTGTVGKTSTKEAIARVLSTTFRVRTSEKNFNNEWGVPFTILDISGGGRSPLKWLFALGKGMRNAFFAEPIADVFVLEYGVDKPGDMRYLTAIASLDIAVVTALGDVPVHVENFPSRGMLWEEKLGIAKALKPQGSFIYNADDPSFGRLLSAVSAEKKIGYGIRHAAHVRADEIRMLWNGSGLPTGISCRIFLRGNSAVIRAVRLSGLHNTSLLLAAAAVGSELGVAIGSIAKCLETTETPPGRMKFIPAINGAWLLDDTYNASPTSTAAALQLLGACPPKRRIAVLGDMLELGEFSEEAHREAGRLAARTCDLLIAVGRRMRWAADEAIKHGMDRAQVRMIDQAAFAVEPMRGILQSGGVALVKGSQGMRMEKIVEALMAEPKRAGELLVRQNPEWKRRPVASL